MAEFNANERLTYLPEKSVMEMALSHNDLAESPISTTTYATKTKILLDEVPELDIKYEMLMSPIHPSIDQQPTSRKVISVPDLPVFSAHTSFAESEAPCANDSLSELSSKNMVDMQKYSALIPLGKLPSVKDQLPETSTNESFADEPLYNKDESSVDTAMYNKDESSVDTPVSRTHINLDTLPMTREKESLVDTPMYNKHEGLADEPLYNKDESLVSEPLYNKNESLAEELLHSKDESLVDTPMYNKHEGLADEPLYNKEESVIDEPVSDIDESLVSEHREESLVDEPLYNNESLADDPMYNKDEGLGEMQSPCADESLVDRPEPTHTVLEELPMTIANEGLVEQLVSSANPSLINMTMYKKDKCFDEMQVPRPNKSLVNIPMHKKHEILPSVSDSMVDTPIADESLAQRPVSGEKESLVNLQMDKEDENSVEVLVSSTNESSVQIPNTKLADTPVPSRNKAATRKRRAESPESSTYLAKIPVTSENTSEIAMIPRRRAALVKKPMCHSHQVPTEVPASSIHIKSAEALKIEDKVKKCREDSRQPRNKICAVPLCKNNTKNTKKLFFTVPSDWKMRNKWNVATGRGIHAALLSCKCHYICEDHFNLKEDIGNYIAYNLMPNVRPRLKKDAVPHIFDCWKVRAANKTSQLVSTAQVRQELKKPATKDASCMVKVPTVSKSTSTPTPTPTRYFISNVEPKKLKVSKKPDEFGSGDYEDVSLYHSKETDEAGSFRRTPFWRKQCLFRSKHYLGISAKSRGLLKKLVLATKIRERDIMLTLMKLKQNDPFKKVSYCFGISPSLAISTFSSVVPVVSQIMKESIIWPPSDGIRANLPPPFRYRFAKVEAIIDCFEVQIEKPANDEHQTRTWSECNNCYTAKYLVSSTPNGLINFISGGYGGGTPDFAICHDSGFLQMVRPGTAVLADHGFKGLETLLQDRQCKLMRPPSVGRGERPGGPKNIATKPIERVIQQFREFSLLRLDAAVSHNMMQILDDLVVIAAGLINCQEAIFDGDAVFI